MRDGLDLWTLSVRMRAESVLSEKGLSRVDGKTSSNVDTLWRATRSTARAGPDKGTQ